MKAVGIVAEYNPLHGGHLYHMEQARALSGAEAVVCVLSGDFVQRGTPAVFSKMARAEAAVNCGASLVLELPLPWSLASAEGFARGAVGLLGATGVVEFLAFGSESGRAEELEALAAALEEAAFPAELRTALETGASFALARERAVGTILGPERAAALREPNNILAVEYLRALRAQRLPMKVLAIRRSGSRHDGAGSARELRAALERGESIAAAVPPGALSVYRREQAAGRGPILERALEQALLARLRRLDREDFAALPDASEGLENLFWRESRRACGLEELLDACKSRRYARSRLRRMACCAALGVRRGMADGIPPYIRVLAADGRGCALLKEMREKAARPVVTKPAGVRELGGKALEIFSLGSAAHDLYVLGCPAREARRGEEDWRRSPYIAG